MTIPTLNLTELRQLAFEDVLAHVRVLHLAQIGRLPEGLRNQARRDMLADGAIGFELRFPSLSWRSTWLASGSEIEAQLPADDLVAMLGENGARELVEAAASMMTCVLSESLPTVTPEFARIVARQDNSFELRIFECAGRGYVAMAIAGITFIEGHFDATPWPAHIRAVA